MVISFPRKPPLQIGRGRNAGHITNMRIPGIVGLFIRPYDTSKDSFEILHAKPISSSSQDLPSFFLLMHRGGTVKKKNSDWAGWAVFRAKRSYSLPDNHLLRAKEATKLRVRREE